MTIDVAQSAIDTDQVEAGTASSEKSMVRIADMARSANMARTAVMSVAMSIENAVGTDLVMMTDTSSIHIILQA